MQCSEAEKIRHQARNPIQCLRLHYNDLARAVYDLKRADLNLMMTGMAKQIARIELALSPERFTDEAHYTNQEETP
jgi:hypothetical protein